MELTNDFRVGVGVERAWSVLTDVERIAPCMPGASLQEVDGDNYRGTVKVKVGPITASYKGTATLVERDDAAHRAVLRAEGRESRGQGNASALVTATLAPDGDGTAVTVVTELTVTGKVASFGRGVLGDVSAKLIGQFVDCLESDLLAGDEPAPAPEQQAAPEPAPAGDGAAPVSPAAPGPARTATARPVPPREVAPVDLLGTAGAPVARRVVPVVVGLLVVLWLLRRRRRRRR
jgi:carbon monoxide dehydrogenase subunit G